MLGKLVNIPNSEYLLIENYNWTWNVQDLL